MSYFRKVFMAKTIPLRLETASRIYPAWLLPILRIILNSYFGFLGLISHTILNVSLSYPPVFGFSFYLRKYFW
jgi:hypothetical protein